MTVNWDALPFLRQVVDAAEVGFVCLDSDMRVVYMSPRAHDIFERDPQTEGPIELSQLLVADDWERVKQVVEELREGSLSGRAPWRTHMTACRGDGSAVAVAVTVSPGPVEAGCAFLAWVEDISERGKLLNELAQALRGSSPGLGDILDSLAEAVTIRDPYHNIIYANTAAVAHMGFASLEELQRRGPQSIIEDYIVLDESGHEITMDDIPSVRLLAGKSAEPMLIRTVHRVTGEMTWDLLKATLIRDEAGAPAASVMIIEDVTTERLAQLRERFLSRASDTLMSSLDYEETLRNVAWLAVPEIADWCAVDLFDSDGRRRQVVVAHRDPGKLVLAEELRRYEQLGNEPAWARVARTGTAELYTEVSDEQLVQGAQDDHHLELLRAVGFRSVMLVPMRARGRTFGVMTLVTAESLRRFDASDVEFAEQLAVRAAVAVDNARLATSRREIAETLQRSLLPDAVPAIEGWEVATMYRPARAADEIEVEVGGDFYDFIETPQGWLVLLGDVTGRGVQAAAMTSLVRHGARFLSKHEHSPAKILAHLDEALREQSALSLCSALCVRLAPDHVVMSSAGHPAPLIVRSDGRLREIGSPGPLLGGWEESAWEDRTLRLDPQETLVMYTDGVTDTRGQASRFGATRLRQLLAENASRPPGELLSELEAELDSFQVAGHSDDTGAVALRQSPAASGEQADVATLAAGDDPVAPVR